MKIAKVLGVYSKAKDGREYRTQKGDTFKIASVNFEDDTRPVRIFIWGNQTCEVGNEYEGEIVEENYQGKVSYVFKGNQKVDKDAEEIAQLKFSLANTNRKLDEIVTYLKGKPWNTAPEITSKGDPMPTF